MVGPRSGWWDRLWFGEAPLVRLAVLRIVLLAAAFYAVWTFRHGVLQHADGIQASFLDRRWNPIYAFEALGIPPPGPTFARVVLGVLLAALTLGIVGLFTRTACAVAGVLTVYWIGVHYSFGKPHHDCVVLAFGLLALPLGPVGARLSVDSLRARLRAARSGTDFAPPDTAPWARLPILVTQITAALGYFFAGATKLTLAGPGWANGYTLQGIMLEYRSAWSGFFEDKLALCVLMSAGMLFVQVTFPLVFASPWLRWFYVPMGIVFHLMAMQTMATGPFLTLWFALIAFVPAERVPAFLGATVARGPLLRRLAVGGLLAAFGWLTLKLYFAQIPPVFALALVPVALSAVLGLVPGLLAEVRYDPANPGARRAVALLDAFDWSGRLRFEARPGLAAGLELGQRAGIGAWRAGARRTAFAPLLLLLPAPRP